MLLNNFLELVWISALNRFLLHLLIRRVAVITSAPVVGLTDTVAANRLKAITLGHKVGGLLLRHFVDTLQVRSVRHVELNQLFKLSTSQHICVVVSTLCKLLSYFY